MLTVERQIEGLVAGFRYSYLKAVIGSTLVALRAGTRHATSVTTPTISDTITKVNKSVGLIPNNRLDITLVKARDAAKPITMPIIASIAP